MNSPSSNYPGSDRAYNFAASAVPQSNGQKSPTSLNYQNSNQNSNGSFSEDTLAQYSFGSSTNHSFGEPRRGFGDIIAHQARAQNSCSTMTSSSDVNEILSRNQQRPRAIFKQRQRRVSPSASQQFTLDMHHSNATASMMNQSFAANSSAALEHNRQSRCHSFSNSNQMLLSPVGLSSAGSNQRSGSLTLDLGSNFSNKSPTSSAGASNCSPDQGYSSWPKQNIFVYEDLPTFHSPTSPCENRSFDDQSSKPAELSILNMNVSWQDSNEDSPTDQPRNKPRNSTFVHANDNSNYNLANSQSTSTSSQPSSLEASAQDYKFAPDLAQDLNEFLAQKRMQELSETFAEKRIDLYTFLIMSQDDLKMIGISKPEHLAALIAGQLNFRAQIGIESSEAMRFVAYLGSNLERVKKELIKLQNELKMYRMGGLHDIDMKGSGRMQNNYPSCF